MAEKSETAAADLEPEDTGFKAPAQKSMEEILAADQEDEALRKYKETLLGSSATAGTVAPVYPDNPANVIVQKIQIQFVDEERAPVELQLHGRNLDELKNSPIVIKEGVNYKVVIYFFVQRDIVSGLRYIQATYKLGVRVAKDDLMVGSYAPKSEPHVYSSPVHEAPSGLMARGSYAVKSRFTDDDKHDFLSWEWVIKIKDNWKD